MPLLLLHLYVVWPATAVMWWQTGAAPAPAKGQMLLVRWWFRCFNGMLPYRNVV